MRKIGAIDARTWQDLSRDGRLGKLARATRVDLSPAACLRRVQALETSGVIRGGRAVIDSGRAGIGFTADVTAGLRGPRKHSRDAFERAMARAAEVRECHDVTGTVEYLLRVECADLTADKRLHTETPGTSPGVAAITTFVVMGSPKDDGA